MEIMCLCAHCVHLLLVLLLLAPKRRPCPTTIAAAFKTRCMRSSAASVLFCFPATIDFAFPSGSLALRGCELLPYLFKEYGVSWLEYIPLRRP